MFSVENFTQSKAFLFRKYNTSLCSFCNLEDEKVIHLFVHCSKTKRLQCTGTEYFKRSLHIPLLSPQSAIFGFLGAEDKVFLILNYLLLLFKYYVYVSRSSKVLSFEAKESDERNRKLFTKYWKTILQNLQNFKKYEVYSFKISCIINTIAVFRTQSHIQDGIFCYNSKNLTTFCLHETRSLMFDSLH